MSAIDTASNDRTSSTLITTSEPKISQHRRRNERRKCYSCRQVGHIAHLCHKRTPVQHANERTCFTEPNEHLLQMQTSERPLCFSCLDFGHLAGECHYNLDPSSNNGLLSTINFYDAPDRSAQLEQSHRNGDSDKIDKNDDQRKNTEEKQKIIIINSGNRENTSSFSKAKTDWLPPPRMRTTGEGRGSTKIDTSIPEYGTTYHNQAVIAMYGRSMWDEENVESNPDQEDEGGKGEGGEDKGEVKIERADQTRVAISGRSWRDVVSGGGESGKSRKGGREGKDSMPVTLRRQRKGKNGRPDMFDLTPYLRY